MSSFETNKDLLFAKVENYVKTTLDLYKLKLVDKTADTVSALLSGLSIAFVLAMFTLFINIGISLYIGKLLHDYYIGFIIVSGFYLILALVLIFFNKSLVKVPVSNLIIDKMLKDLDIDEIVTSVEKKEDYEKNR